MLVDDHLGLFARCPETVTNEIDFGFHHGEIVLRAALQYKSRAKRGQVGNAGNIKEHILWQYCRQTSQDFLRLPSLALEVDDVRLHEDGTAVAEDGHGLRGKGKISVLVNVYPEPFRRRLQKISVTGGALGI